jgi:FtsP/CotA-like multicopper oxidase with cupredoxin domain
VDVEINMQASTTAVPILPGTPTQVMSYQATLVKGSQANLITLPDNYLGPIIRVRQGQRLKVNFTNGLPEDTTVHFHGPCIPSHMGGHPHGTDVVHPGGTFIYEFDILDQASPLWFHPHPDLRTGFQVYYGLAGLCLVTDDVEAQAGLDTGEYDVPLVIQDRIFDANNQFVYLSGGIPMMGMMQGFLGNRILVNGKPDYVQSVAPGTYRLRLYNGSNARTYRLAWQDGTPLLVLGTDGGLLPNPVQRNYVTLAPAERVDLWVDFTGKSEGTELVMQSLAFQTGMMGGGMMGGGMMGSGMGGMMGGGMMGSGMGGMMGGGMMGSGMGGMMTGQAVLAQGAAFPVFKVRIEGSKKSPLTLPKTLVGTLPYQLQDAVNISSPRTIYLGMQHMVFTLNGRVFDMDAIAADEYIPLEQLEVWDFVNLTMIAHPMHIHNVQFNVIERQSSMAGSPDYQLIKAGFVDDGWKDTVLVMPGERVRLLVKFLTYSGMYMYHCHILEHEGMGMMRNLMVGDSSDSMNMP